MSGGVRFQSTDLKEKLIDDVKKPRCKSAQHPLKVGITMKAGAKPTKRGWTMATASEKTFEKVQVDVDVTAEDFAVEATAKITTPDTVAQTNPKLGKAMRRVTTVFDRLVPAVEDDEEAEGEVTISEKEAAASGLQTNGEATLNVLNQCLGSGMLGMGFCISQTGLVMGLITMICSLFLNKRTLFLNMATSDLAGVPPASTEVGAVAFGRGGQLILVIMVALLGFFCMVSYIDASSDAVMGLLSLKFSKDELPSEHVISVICWFFLLMPPTWIRSMSLVAMLSFVAFVGSILIVVSVVGVCAQVILTTGLPPMSEIRMFPKDAASFLTAMPILVLVFSIQAGGDVVLATMKDSSEANKQKVAFFAQRIVLCMLYGVGALCYIAFGDAVQGDVLQNFPAMSVPGIVSRLASLDLVVLSYMIMMIPCKVSVIDLVFGKNEAMQESSFLQYYGTVTVLNIAALAVALVVSDLSLVLGVDGAVCTNFVAFLLPAAFWMKVQSKPADPNAKPVPVFSCSNWPYFLIFAFGFASLCMSSYQVMQRFLQK